MINLDYNIGQIPFGDEKWACGIAYVTIPSDVDRGTFIYESIRKGTITIKTEDGGIFRNCPVSKNVFNYLSWPQRYQDNGTPVFYVTEPKHQQPVVIGALNFNDEIVDHNENEFRISRERLNSLVQIIGNSENGDLLFMVQGDERSNLNIRLSHPDNKSELSIDIDGVYDIKATKNIETSSQTNITNRVGESEDDASVIDQTSSEVNVRVPKFILNDGEEAMVLGNMWKDFMDSFIDEIASSTVTTSLGQMPLLNAAQITRFKTRTEEILSEYGFLK